MALKYPWFKFAPTDWVMGKIQRCPEITQARFIRLCCLYWNKECVLSIEDSIIEIDKDHLDLLLDKKIIKSDSTFIKIDFLDEQNDSCGENSERKRLAALARWSKNNPTELQNDAGALHVHTSAMQNDADRKTDKREKKDIKIIIPSFEDFKLYAIEKKPKVCLDALKLKYDVWIESDWHDGNGSKIVNWKTKLLNTLPFIADKKITYKNPPF